MKLFSSKNRPVHLGPYPMERLRRIDAVPDLTALPISNQLSFQRADAPQSIVNAMGEYQAMMDVIRDGLINLGQSDVPDNMLERTNHIKAFGYFSDASLMGVCQLPQDAILETPFRNPDIARLGDALNRGEVKSLASGIDATIADLRESLAAPETPMFHHEFAVVVAIEYPRDPGKDEPGCGWIEDAQAHRACLRASEVAVVLAQYFRLLGYEARAHSGASSDVDLGRLAVAAGLASIENGEAINPYMGDRFGLAAVTTTFALAPDQPLAPLKDQPKSAFGLDWKLGRGTEKSAGTATPFAKRRFKDGEHPFEKLKRVDDPTTYIDEPNVARVPKRTDMFARALFGDMGKKNQEAATGGKYVRKSAPSSAQRRALGAFTVIQNGDPAPEKHTLSPDDAANLIKATAYFLGADAVGLSRCPDYAYYSHNAFGEVIDPYHDQAISLIIDQGFETMEGASGDDWISVAQSMRAYLRFSLIGGVLAQQIRNLGYSARAHTVTDGEVLQPPLLLLSGLGEVSRIGEVILNPYLGPRLKSGVVTTDLPFTHDKPIDFGLQNFCENCNKCARECPAGAITAGPKLMFNGYEIWKSDSQKCASYRITTLGGSMCGRCMKTCPWNLEGLFAEAPFRWAAMNVPQSAPLLAKLDDAANRGTINPVKKWWWDLELMEDGGYRPTPHSKNERTLQKELDLKYEDQTLAVYPAPLAPHPYPYPFPMDREAGIKAYGDMVDAATYKHKAREGRLEEVSHRYTNDKDSPVIPVIVSKAEKMSPSVTKYEFRHADGDLLPEWTAGSHIDIVVAPEYLRQYSMSGDPADRKTYQIGVLREDDGRGGSLLMHRIFEEGRKVFISPPINHFELAADATKHLLMGGGIGITPMIAFAHSLHARGEAFEMHYSISTRAEAGYLYDLAAVPWADKVHLHVSDENTRADLDAILGGYELGHHVYTCGPDRYMAAVIDAATAAGFPEEARHLEYFNVPEPPDYENHPFILKLARSGKTVEVSAEETATDALARIGVHVDVKCSDGICGVCKCGLISGEVEHRDYVLSKAQRETQVILCQSRAAKDGGVVEVDL